MGLGLQAVTVLAYHEIAARATPTAVSPRRFEAQVQLLQDMGRLLRGLQEAVAGQQRRTVAITFDDGHLETYTRAYPILSSRGIPATVYVATGFVSTQNWFEPGGRPMTWAMIRELAEAGWTVGSHSVSHARLTQLADRELREELVVSRRTLEDAMGQPCRHFCAPYGDMDQRVLEAAREAGFLTAALSLPARHALPDSRGVVLRSGIYPGTGWTAFRLKARGWDRHLRGGSLRRQRAESTKKSQKTA